MFFHVLQNIALLIFAGIGAYAIFSNSNLQENNFLRQIMIGLLMGVMLFLVTSNAYIIDDVQAPLDGKTGLLLYAGYLGGPVGGLVAAAVGALVRITIGGPNVWIGVGLYPLFALFGALIGMIYPSTRWPRVPRTAIFALLAGSVLLQFAPAPFAMLDQEANPENSLLTIGVALALAGILSTIIMTAVLHYANFFVLMSHSSNRNARRLHLAVKSANIGIFEREAGQDTAHFDKGMLRIFGIPGEERQISSEVWIKMIVPEDLPELNRTLHQVWIGNSPSTPTLFRIVRPGGDLRYVQAHWQPETSGAGKVSRVIGIYADVTDSIQLELKSEQTENRLTAILENLPGALHSIEIDPNGQMEMQYMSSYCQAIWGYTKDELQADPSVLRDMHDPDDLPDMLNAIQHAAKTLTNFKRRFRVTTRDGEKKWLEMHSSTTPLTNGKAQIDSIFLDVTAEMKAQEELAVQMRVSHQAQKNESIGHLTGGVAHDFNNLLAVVMGNLELLREELSDKNQITMIDASIAAALRGANLTQSMLAFARKARLEPEVIDLNKLVRDTKNWTGRTLPASIQVETSLLAGLWPIEADPSSTESALLNLILNARDAMEDRGKLTIETANIRIDEAYVDAREVELQPGRYVMLAVSDTGHGIAPEAINDIFEPFFSTKGPGKGSGLGLSMIQGFMRQSGGTVQVYSEPGVGTTFKLYFMVSEKLLAPAEIYSSPEHSSRIHGRILLVEDQQEVLQVLMTSLQKSGYDVTPARSGDEARDIFEADPTFDLLLTDIVMPGNLLGTKLALVLRETNPDLPVIFMSGYASEATVHGNGLRPTDIRMMKPIQRQDLLKAIAKSLH